jgi:hypothetical protein
MLPTPNTTELSEFLANLLLCHLVPATDSACQNCSRHIQILNPDSITDNEIPNTHSPQPIIRFLATATNDQIRIEHAEARAQSIVDLIAEIDKTTSDQTKISYMLHLFSALQKCMEEEATSHQTFTQKQLHSRYG